MWVTNQNFKIATVVFIMVLICGTSLNNEHVDKFAVLKAGVGNLQPMGPNAACMNI